MKSRSCLVEEEGSSYDLSNLLTEERLHKMLNSNEADNDQQDSSADMDLRVPLYPNLRDPCNKRLLQAVATPEWKSVPLVKPEAAEQASDKYNEFYDLQRRDMEQLQHQHQQQQHLLDLSHAQDFVTELPRRAQTAPLHSLHSGSHAPVSPAEDACSLPSFSPQTTLAATISSSSSHTANSTSRQSLPPIRRPQRHSTTAVPGDIHSSSSGLRPRVNYKSLYSRRANLSAGKEEDATSTTMQDSTHFSDPLEDPVHEYPEEEEEPAGTPTTMEIAPNVRVQVRSSQETYKAVQSGEYTVATCFACTATIVCVDDAAYVLCPDCQVVSPLCVSSPQEASKKDDPYGIGTGLRREMVNQWVGSI